MFIKTYIVQRHQKIWRFCCLLMKIRQNTVVFCFDQIYIRILLVCKGRSGWFVIRFLHTFVDIFMLFGVKKRILHFLINFAFFAIKLQKFNRTLNILQILNFDNFARVIYA